MLRVIGVGDNVVDRYLDMNTMFPGGNAVNFAALARRYGFESAYVGVVGKDAAGDHIRESLVKEGVDVSHMQIAPGSTAFTDVSLEAGERVFKGFDLSIYGKLVLSAEDLEYIRGYHLAHTSVYSRITRYLPEIRKGSILISFDFSDKWANDVMECVTPQIDYAFMSGSGKSDEEIEARMKRLVELGAKLAVITKGSKGAVSYDGMEFYHQPIVPAQVVDTLGAGDAFITMFLVNYLISKDIPYSMRLAAEAAAVACSYYGAFGHGVPIK